MASGGVYVKVKKSKSLMDMYPNSDPYQMEDISSEIVHFLIIQHEFERDEARELVEWYTLDEEDTNFINQVKLEYLQSGLFKKEYFLD